MRHLCYLLGLVLVPVALGAADLRPALRREAGKCAAAWERSDCERILTYLPPQMIKRSGGRTAVLREIQSHFAQAREYGVEQWEVVPEMPSPPRPVGRWLTSLIPVMVVLHRTPLDLTQETHVLGLSADQGKHWYFVILYQLTQKELNAMFPEFAGRIVIPTDPEPDLSAFR